jgi:hypothetical protein
MATRVPSPREVVSDSELFASSFLHVQDKQKALVPFKWNPVQRKLHHNRTGRDLILKARQMGMTTYLQGELFRRAVTSPRTTLTLTQDADATEKLRLMADRFYQHCDFNGIKPQRKYANSSMATYPEFDSTVAISTAGKLSVGRGSTFTDIHGSEVAFWPDAEKILAGALQAGNPDVVLESTPNGASGWFYELSMESLSGRGVWKLHFFPWWEDPTYIQRLEADEVMEFTDEESLLVAKHGLSAEQIKWRRNKKSELKRLFTQEYPEDPVTCFLTSGDSYFPVEILSMAFTAPFGATYDPTHIYTAGLDFGQSNDFTYMPIIDRTANVQVDYLYVNRQPWAEQRRKIKNMYLKWHVATLLAEKNSIGSVNIEELQADFVNVTPFETTNESKGKLIGDYYDALENGLKLLDWDVQKAEHYAFVATQLPSGVWRLAAKGDGHDDTVLGNAMAIGARMQALKARSFRR